MFMLPILSIALLLNLLFPASMAPAQQPAQQICVNVASGIPELGSGIVVLRPDVVLFVQPTSDAGRQVAEALAKRVTPKVSIQLCLEAVE